MKPSIPVTDRIRNFLPLGLLAVAVAVALTCPPTRSQAAVLTAVPMQGGMVMPMISYRAADGTLHVAVDPTIPQLTPLRISHPDDAFAPGDPWFDDLDPSRQGRSFSRRLALGRHDVSPRHHRPPARPGRASPNPPSPWTAGPRFSWTQVRTGDSTG